eukprot:Skav227257  [mRNA]  locus=scaffold378:86766:87593:- [translate_table: standard]
MPPRYVLPVSVHARDMGAAGASSAANAWRSAPDKAASSGPAHRVVPPRWEARTQGDSNKIKFEYEEDKRSFVAYPHDFRVQSKEVEGGAFQAVQSVAKRESREQEVQPSKRHKSKPIINVEELERLKGMTYGEGNRLPTKDLVAFLTRYFGYRMKRGEHFEFSTHPSEGGFVAVLEVLIWSSQSYVGRWAWTGEAAREEAAKDFLLQPEVFRAAENLPPPIGRVRDFFFYRLKATDLYRHMLYPEFKAVVEEYTREYISQCLDTGCRNAFTDGRA